MSPVIQLFCCCTSENPADRPSAKDIILALKPEVTANNVQSQGWWYVTVSWKYYYFTIVNKVLHHLIVRSSILMATQWRSHYCTVELVMILDILPKGCTLTMQVWTLAVPSSSWHLTFACEGDQEILVFFHKNHFPGFLDFTGLVHWKDPIGAEHWSVCYQKSLLVEKAKRINQTF